MASTEQEAPMTSIPGHDRNLGQTLIVRPEIPFGNIENAMQRLGWSREVAVTPQGDSLLSGEPELASWSAGGQKPTVTYTFNPVVALRVLDVATVPPVARRMIAERLPVLSEVDVERLLVSNDVKNRLLGVWAAQETERIDLIDAIIRLQQDSDSTVAREAARAVARLERVAEARLQVFTKLRLLADAASALVAQFSDPAFVSSLQPSLADCVDLFDKQIGTLLFEQRSTADQAVTAIPRISAGTEITVTAAPAGLLRWSNELSDRFPLAYRDIAGWMNPGRVWLTWTVGSKGSGQTRYDGLAWLGDRWVWLPKVYRDVATVLGPLLDVDTQLH
jgi:hypothetical protein